MLTSSVGHGNNIHFRAAMWRRLVGRRALCTSSRHSDTAVFRMVAPTAILGYGFPEASFAAAMAGPVDLIAVDGGSIDPGPYYLATRSSFTALPHVLRDLRIMLEGFLAQRQNNPRCKLVIGSAGGCGSNNQVDLLAHHIPRLLYQISKTGRADKIPVLATVTSELVAPQQILGERQLSPLGWMPDLDPKHTMTDSVVVAQMGLEPVICALEHADIVLCGRAYDPAVFAAEPIRRGYPAGAALHAAKVLECGAIAAVPGSGSDCLVAELQYGHNVATVFAPNPLRTATALSVAAHTLYEKSHPHCFGLPSGVLDTSQTRFIELDDGRVQIAGSKLLRTPPTVKLEGAAVRGHRAVRLTQIAADVESEDLGAESGFIYGLNGVEPNRCTEGTELGIVLSVTGATAERREAHLALLRATLLHWGFEGRKATAGNLAFPFSPSDLTVAGANQVLTVCGSRDPLFVEKHQQILEDVAAYVETLGSTKGLQVEWRCFGLPDMPKLRVEEFVAQKEAEAMALATAAGRSGWLCHGGKAADYTMQHLVQLDEQLCKDLFKIEIVGSGQQITPRLVAWGEGPVISSSEALAGWSLSNKPVAAGHPKNAGTSSVTLGNLARVVRSKNAGVNELTFDIFFDDFDSYAIAKGSSALDGPNVGKLLGRSILGVFCDDNSFAIKITCDRGMLAGSNGDRDVYGAQQHANLLGVLL